MATKQRRSRLAASSRSNRDTAAAQPSDNLPPFGSLRAFDAVGRVGGMRRAAATLGIDPTVVSRHIHALERWMGVALVNRAEGVMRLTEQGRQYHARISPAIADISAATADVRRRADLDRLRIWCVPGFGFQWLAPQLTTLRAAFPNCQIEFHPTDDSPDFGRDSADIDIRFVLDGMAPPSPKHVTTFEFSRPPSAAVASPKLAAKIKANVPADLLQAPLIHEADDVQWLAWFHRHGIETPATLPGIRVWHAHVVLEAARNGEGVAQANGFLVRDDLLSGRLVLLGPKATPGFAIVFGGYRVSARESEWHLEPVRRFRHWLLKTAANHRLPF